MPCFRQDEVFTGYHGRRLRRDVIGRIGPGEHFPAARNPPLQSGGRFAVTSTRNPDAKPDPPMRPAVDGWRYGYPLVRRKGVLAPGSGCWVPDDALAPDGPGNAWARGPAFLDFHVGRGKPRKKKRSSTPRPKPGLRYRVRSAETYVRYAPHSTSIGYLQRGDTVRVLASTGFYRCVRVVESSSLPEGTTGWVLAIALRRG